MGMRKSRPEPIHNAQTCPSSTKHGNTEYSVLTMRMILVWIAMVMIINHGLGIHENSRTQKKAG
ncbi:hypothetical protein P175DRAFT_0503698 [Aspergillus ochraceoroseus IBT 24754]|uniref:Uncharacterized protein n=1 Tax=Aspergillus ochraceoroseus IBT 24754 TaxID=1392256 RepID=A0A2T5LRH3_9EURO|nr:uncharacterized protein P175DRAFT_0503698 [Aspergillus ochraceoroseus IBT 24754]PTU18879.1 hypothetical protein P175DRAFT_0503698 [Aspergillus ochraceoroseus IBT 24754]